jgi:aspartate kinase
MIMEQRGTLVVQKFGGTSVADADKLTASAAHVLAARRNGKRVVVVVSAMGDTTDNLLDLARTVHGDDPAALATPEYRRELDQLLATGEQVAIALFAMTLRRLGVPAVSLTGPQAGITTDDAFTRATITSIHGTRLVDLLEAGTVPVVAGFQGVSPAGEITTLGRGGSDTTAVALATFLGGSCEIYKDVDGVYTADPQIVPAAQRLESVTYDEMLEAASLGAQVIHPRAVELARKYTTPVRVLHSQHPPGREGAGTVLVAEDPNHHRPVTSVVLKRGVGRVSIRGLVNRAGVQSQVFGPLARAHVAVDDIIQEDDGPGTIGLTFTLDRRDLAAAQHIIQQAAQGAGAESVRTDAGFCTVSAVGSGMRTASGVAARLFRALAEERIRVENITTSEIRISCVVGEKDGPRAARAVHTAFGLDAQPPASPSAMHALERVESTPA